MDALDVSGLTFAYPGCDRPALDGVSFAVRAGEFIALCGRSGSGKSTLLRHLKTQLAPHGERSGSVRFFGVQLDEVGPREEARGIGFVLQDPESQIVTETVEHELAFGLENLGVPSGVMRMRVAEMASFFGMAEWLDRSVHELSGGQKQLVNLAAVMALQPRVLVLDEPTAQLDPIAATEFLNTVRRINQELGTTVVLSEQRLEEVLPLADRALVLQAGRVLAYDAPSVVCRALAASGDEMVRAMPTAARVHLAVTGAASPDAGAGDASAPWLPLTVREGRAWLAERLAGAGDSSSSASDFPAAASVPASDSPEPAPVRPAGALARSQDPIIELKDVWFRYGKTSPDVLRGLSLAVERGSWHCIMGANGAGKTTTLGVMAGLDRPYRGRVRYEGRPLASYGAGELYRRNLGVMPQNPQALFVEQTVRADVAEALGDGPRDEDRAAAIERVCELTEIEDLMDRHPLDLSGGERQRVALTKVLLGSPRVLMLDEPTKGLDSPFKRRLARILRRLQDKGVTVIMVSHDIEFCARYADACSLVFRGAVSRTAPARAFFAGNSFYTTAANRMARDLVPGAVLDEDVIEACRIR